MGAVTYPEAKVVEFVEKNFVPVQIPVSNTTLMEKYQVKWTPTLLVVDTEGYEHFRRVGFFDPDDLVANLMTGKGRYFFDGEQFFEAASMFKAVQDMYPGTEAAAEAIFYLGVTGYKMNHDPKALRQAYDTLMEKYPHSQWSKQASVYRLIDK